MLDEIMINRVEKVIISYKDRLSRVGFVLFSYLFKKFRTEIIVISEVGNAKLDSEEVFEEISSTNIQGLNQSATGRLELTA